MHRINCQQVNNYFTPTDFRAPLFLIAFAKGVTMNSFLARAVWVLHKIVPKHKIIV